MNQNSIAAMLYKMRAAAPTKMARPAAPAAWKLETAPPVYGTGGAEADGMTPVPLAAPAGLPDGYAHPLVAVTS